MHALFGLVCGLLFGTGLIIAQMTNPDKVIGFLDILDGWDPSLAFVMVSGLVVFGLGFMLLKQRDTSLLGDTLVLPSTKQIDSPLIVGASLFGLGWGLIGLCPGPAIAAIVIGSIPAYIFSAAMIAAMLLHHVYEMKRN